MEPSESETSPARDETGARPLLDARVPALVAQIALALSPLTFFGLVAVGLVNEILRSGAGEAGAPLVWFIEISGIVEIGLRTATAAAFITWLHRASKNMRALVDEPPEHGPAAAIYVWFIPCANLWMPHPVVREIEAKSDPERTGAASSPIGAWWVSWIVLQVLLNTIPRANGDLAAMLTAPLLGVQLLAATQAVMVVRRIQKNLVALATGVGTTPIGTG